MCPHCGKSPGLVWWALLPSNSRTRVLTCKACGGKFDLSDTAKMASIFGGLLGIGPGIYLFGHLLRVGGRSALMTIAGTGMVVVAFVLGASLLTFLTLRLVVKR
jgi:hypothetical protein